MTCLVALTATVSFASEPDGFREDAELLERLVDYQYAYLDRLPDGDFALTETLKSEAAQVRTRAELIRFAERALLLLEDHHAITGASLSDSWAVFPSFGDLWIERRGDDYVVEQVREDSPAARAGILAGDRLVGIGDEKSKNAVENFWRDLGVTDASGDGAFAARILAAGKRDRPRNLTLQRGSDQPRKLQLPSLYSVDEPEKPMLSAGRQNDDLIIKFHDSLGQTAAIAAFDAAMAEAEQGQHVIIDLTDTASGGNTVVARAIMGWFVQQPTAYQIHQLPAEMRRTGIARQWIEQVLPRAGKYHSGPITVRVGRWTGSMGEGLAIGLDAIGATIEGTRMAGLLGAIYDERLPNSQLVVKLPAERLYSPAGTPREEFDPASR
ncbi:hypothetical protein J3454_10180 [Erythrobacter sp. NFXS35]|uniref:S41 family peptidase n=1 Tax=Erythrobacter sp. NFXS35 TaxID=2818436 RepID=UPI0032DEC328